MARPLIRMIGRHAIVAAIGVIGIWVFWLSRPVWVPEMRFWKAVGDAALVMLILTLAIGPLARLWRPFSRWLSWRRELGIWFALLSLFHTVLILNGWARWSVDRFFGYEFIPQLGRIGRMEPGFGLANLIGLIALVWAVLLAATSSDLALRRLGPRAWKWLHTASYAVFYLITAHVGYFLFIHFSESFHRQAPAPDWFRLPFLVTAGIVVGLQAAAFVVTVRRGAAAARRSDETGSHRKQADIAVG